jgi:hypothetical protein
LTCDDKDLWYLRCDKVLTMGCTEADLNTSAQSLEEDGTPVVAAVVAQEDIAPEAGALSSGALGLATGVASLVLVVVVAVAA